MSKHGVDSEVYTSIFCFKPNKGRSERYVDGSGSEGSSQCASRHGERGSGRVEKQNEGHEGKGPSKTITIIRSHVKIQVTALTFR